MPVIAHCSACEDRHELGDRTARIGGEPATCSTTECPLCGSSRYSSDVVNRSPKSQDERLSSAITGVSGIGEKNGQNLVDSFNTMSELEDASVSRLTEIDGIGRKTAKNIQDAV